MKYGEESDFVFRICLAVFPGTRGKQRMFGCSKPHPIFGRISFAFDDGKRMGIGDMTNKDVDANDQIFSQAMDNIPRLKTGLEQNTNLIVESSTRMDLGT